MPHSKTFNNDYLRNLAGITPSEIEHRKGYLELTPEDEKNIRVLAPLLAQHADSLVDSFYRHQLEFEETRHIIKDKKTLYRLLHTQKQYFLRLLEGVYDEPYFDDRLRVGLAHYLVNLLPKYYVGSYAIYLKEILPLILESAQGDIKKSAGLLNSLIKVLFLDMTLALDVYHGKQMEEITQQKDQLAFINKVGRVTSSSLQKEEVYETFLNGVSKLVPYDRINIFLLTPEGNEVLVEAGEVSSGTFETPEIQQGMLIPLEQIPLNEILVSGKSYLNPNLQANQRYLLEQQLVSMGIGSYVAVPIVSRGKVLGSFNLAHRSPNAYGEKEIELLEVLSQQLAIAIENSRLFHEVEEKLTTQTLLNELSRELTQFLDIKELSRHLVSSLRDLLKVPFCALWLLGDKNEILPMAMVGTSYYTEEEAMAQAFSQCITAWVVKHGEHAIVEDLSKDERFTLREFAKNEGLVSGIWVPIWRKQRVMGVIACFTWEKRRFSQEEYQLLSTITHQLSTVIENASLYDSLKEYARNLEEKVSQRTAELEIKNKKLEELAQVRAEFISVASHDMRSPITALLGFSEMLLREKEGKLTETQKTYVRGIHSSGEQVLSMINDYLDISRIDAGMIQVSPREFIVSHAVVESVNSMRSLIQKKKLSVEVEVAEMLPPVKADPRHFKQIVVNYLSNAIKFTPEGGKITIMAELMAEEKKTGYIKISVVDTGVGISKADQKKLFRRFVQVGSRANVEKGTGLGLSIVKSLTELQGGKVGVHSVPGQGSTFWFTLPVHRKAQSSAEAIERLLGGNGPAPSNAKGYENSRN